MSVGTAAYLGLAVLGLGPICGILLSPNANRADGRDFRDDWRSVFSPAEISVQGRREDRSNRWVLTAFGLIGLLNAYLPAYTDRKEFWTIAEYDAYCARTSRLIPGLY